MNIKKLLLPLMVLVICGFTFSWVSNSFVGGEKSYKPRNTIMDEKGFAGAIEWLNARRADLTTGEVSAESRAQAVENYLAFHNKQTRSTMALDWIEMGPNNVGGRTRAILFDKTNPDIMFAGAVSGGLWKSTTGGSSWNKVPGMEFLIIGSICQAANGDIYIGTGEGFTVSNSTSGFWGQGIYKSTDGGNTFAVIPSTWDGTAEVISTFKSVYSLAAHPTNPLKIYAATQKGLQITTDGGATWSNPITGVDADQVSSCVKLSTDGNVVIASVNKRVYVCNTGDDVFVKKSGNSTGLVSTGVSRIELSIAPSNSNYMYCLAANSSGAMEKIYQSKDKGETWNPVVDSPSPSVNIFGDNNQGWYDNVIAVCPDDAERFIAGGVDVWHWKENYINLLKLTAWFLSETNPNYVHADIHTIVFHPNYKTPTNPNGNQTVFVGCDGGLFRSVDGGMTWMSMNKNYNVTQFYSVAMSGDGRVMGGTQDNGTKYMDFTGTSIYNAVEVSGGDGGYTEMSQLNPDVLFSTIYYGQLFRSEDRGLTRTSAPSEVYSNNLITSQGVGTSGSEPFITPIRLWESYYDTMSNVMINFIAPRTYALGETIYAMSKSKRYVRHVITQADVIAAGDTIQKDDTIFVKDHYSSMLAVGLNGKVWMTRQGIDFSTVPPYWYPIANPSGLGQVQTLEFSRDGNYLYFTNGSTVYRTSNLNNARTALTTDCTVATNVLTTQAIGTFSQFVTGIAVDPQNANNVVITTGNYNQSQYVWYSNNAATTTSTTLADNFVSKQGNLPAFPAYSAIINWDDSREVVIGTEFGIYATSDITATTPAWTEENNGIDPVPVFMLRQQVIPNGWSHLANSPTDITNHGIIYAGTHGRGIFRCETYKGPVGINENLVDNLKTSVKVYPNPVVDHAVISYNLSKSGDVEVVVYDLRGAVVLRDKRENAPSGEFTLTLDRNDMKAGIYVYSVVANGEKATGKFIVQ